MTRHLAVMFALLLAPVAAQAQTQIPATHIWCGGDMTVTYDEDLSGWPGPVAFWATFRDGRGRKREVSVAIHAPLAEPANGRHTVPPEGLRLRLGTSRDWLRVSFIAQSTMVRCIQ